MGYEIQGVGPVSQPLTSVHCHHNQVQLSNNNMPAVCSAFESLNPLCAPAHLPVVWVVPAVAYVDSNAAKGCLKHWVACVPLHVVGALVEVTYTGDVVLQNSSSMQDSSTMKDSCSNQALSAPIQQSPARTPASTHVAFTQPCKQHVQTPAWWAVRCWCQGPTSLLGQHRSYSVPEL